MVTIKSVKAREIFHSRGNPTIEVEVICSDGSIGIYEDLELRDGLCDYLRKGVLKINDGLQKIPGDSLKNVYKSFVNNFPIASSENPFDQDDWEHCAKSTVEIGEQVQIVGDDLLVTNPKL